MGTGAGNKAARGRAETGATLTTARRCECVDLVEEDDTRRGVARAVEDLQRQRSSKGACGKSGARARQEWSEGPGVHCWPRGGGKQVHSRCARSTQSQRARSQRARSQRARSQRARSQRARSQQHLPNEPLRLAHVGRDEFGPLDREEGEATLGRHRLGEQRLAGLPRAVGHAVRRSDARREARAQSKQTAVASRATRGPAAKARRTAVASRRQRRPTAAAHKQRQLVRPRRSAQGQKGRRGAIQSAGSRREGRRAGRPSAASARRRRGAAAAAGAGLSPGWHASPPPARPRRAT
eukprot:1584309-Prymnesium_polylepis.1